MHLTQQKKSKKLTKLIGTSITDFQAQIANWSTLFKALEEKSLTVINKLFA